MHAEHRLLTYNIVVYAPAHKAVAVYRSATSDDGNIRTRKYLTALLAPIFQEYVTRLPFLNTDPSLIVFQIDHPPHKPLFTEYLPASAHGTPFRELCYRRGKRKSPFSLWRTVVGLHFSVRVASSQIRGLVDSQSMRTCSQPQIQGKKTLLF